MNDDERTERKNKLLTAWIVITIIGLYGASFAINYSSMEKSAEKAEQWPNPTLIGEDESYTYYEFTTSDAKYNAAVEYILSVGGEITSEKEKARWWTDFQYRVPKVVA